MATTRKAPARKPTDKPAAKTTAGAAAAKTRAAAAAEKAAAEESLAAEQAAAAQKARLIAEAKAAAEAVQFDEDGVAQIPASKGSTPEGSFRFRIPGNDRLWSLPNLQYVTIAEAQGFKNKSTETVMAELLDKHAPDILQYVDGAQLSVIAYLWKEHSTKDGQSAISVGESSPS